MNRMTRVRYLSSYLKWVSHQDFKCMPTRRRLYANTAEDICQHGGGYMPTRQRLHANPVEVICLNRASLKWWRTHRQTPIPLIDSAHPVGWAEWKFVYYASEHAFVMALSKCALLVGLIWIMKQSMKKTAGVIRIQLVERSPICPLWLSSNNRRWSILVMNQS